MMQILSYRPGYPSKPCHLLVDPSLEQPRVGVSNSALATQGVRLLECAHVSSGSTERGLQQKPHGSLVGGHPPSYIWRCENVGVKGVKRARVQVVAVHRQRI